MFARHLLLGVAFLIAATLADSALAQGMLDTVVNSAANASTGWMDRSLEFAKTLFFGLAAIEFVWAAVQLTLQKGELSELAVGLLMKIVAISFFSMILSYAPEWIPAVINSFKQAGATVGNSSYGHNGTTNMQTCGAGTISPSAVLDQGVCVATKLTTTALEKMGIEDGSPNLVDVLSNFFPMMMLGLSSIAVLIGFVVLAIQLAIALVESFIVVGGGALMLGFLGSRWTMSFGERYFGYAVSIGAKLFTLYLIIGFGESFVNALVQYIANDIANSGTINNSTLLGTAGGSLVYGAIGYLVPGLASSMLNGSPSLSMSNVGQAGKGVASAPVNASLAGGAAGARLGAGGAAAAGWLMSKFGGGGGGSIIGSGGGGGPSGSIIGSGSRNPFGSTSAAGGTPVTGSAPTAGSAPATSTPTGDAPAAGSAPATSAQSGNAPTGSAPPGDPSTTTAPAVPAPSDGAASTGAAPGFEAASPPPGPRTMDPDRRMHDAMTTSQGRTKPGNKVMSFAQRLNNLSRELQYASYRHNTSLGHDGNTGSAPSIRLNI